MVAATSPLTWDATLSIIRELTDLYSGVDTDDVSDASSIPSLVSKVRGAYDDACECVKVKADELERRVREKEATVERENVEEVGNKMKELHEREERLNAEVARIGSEVSSYQSQIDAHKSTISSELSLLNSVSSSAADELPRIKHAISLYANITNIKFDYSADGRLKGQVAIPDKEEVHGFDIDAAKCTGYDIADRLWGMMEKGAE